MRGIFHHANLMIESLIHVTLPRRKCFLGLSYPSYILASLKTDDLTYVWPLAVSLYFERTRHKIGHR